MRVSNLNQNVYDAKAKARKLEYGKNGKCFKMLACTLPTMSTSSSFDMGQYEVGAFGYGLDCFNANEMNLLRESDISLLESYPNLLAPNHHPRGTSISFAKKSYFVLVPQLIYCLLCRFFAINRTSPPCF